MWLAASAVVVLGVVGSGVSADADAAPPPATAARAAPAVPIPACAQAGPCVVVQVVAGTQVTDERQFYADQVTDQGDVKDVSYPVEGGTDAVVQQGSSLSRLVAQVVDLGAVTFAEVVAPPPDAYSRHLLTAAEVRAAGTGFEGDLLPAFYSTDPDRSHPTRFNYVRPQRDPDDANGAPGPDQGTFFSDLRGALLVRVHTTGSLLDVEATGTPTDETRRTFALSSDPTGAAYTYDWILPGGEHSTEATPTYTFPSGSKAGSYPATVGLEAADGSFGWGRTELTTGPQPSQSQTPSSPGAGGDGPGDDGPTDDPTDGASGDPDPTDGTGGPTGTASADPTSTGTPAPTGDATTGTASAAPTVTAPPPSGPPPSAAGADEITGILLAAADTGEQGGASADAPLPSRAARPLGDDAFTLGASIWVGTGVVLLLLAGAGSESGRVRGWLRGRWTRISP